VSRRHRATLERIFELPARADVEWREVEALLRALGAEISEGRGSRMRIALNGTRAVFHRPHPGKELGRGAVRSMREFLENAGVSP
jgi:predicted RNA binding protein YcfA (HicA-like mRNA interferase family)